MARKPQKLINYHGSVKGNLSKNDLWLGEVAVVHNPNEPLLAIHVSGTSAAEDKIEFFAGSAATHGAIEGVRSNLQSQITSIADAVGKISAKSLSALTSVSAEGDDYIEASFDEKTDSADTTQHLTVSITPKVKKSKAELMAVAQSGFMADAIAIKDEIVELSAATVAYVDGEVAKITSDLGEVKTGLGNLSGEVMTLQTNFNAVSGVVETINSDYTTHEDVSASTRYAIASGKAYTDAVSGYIETRINAVNQDLEEKIETTNNNLTGLSASVISNETKIGKVETDFKAVSGVVETIQGNYTKREDVSASTAYGILSAKTYTDDKVSSIESDLSTVKTNISNLSSATITIESNLNIVSGVVNTINSDYTKHSEVSASTNYGIAQASAYTKTVSGYIETRINAVNNTLDEKITNVDEKATTSLDMLSGFTVASGAVKSYVDEEIKKSVTSVYRIKGTVDSPEDLPTSGQTVGDVWNIKNEFVYEGKTYPAGTNVVWVKPDGEPAKWDALGGTVDLSPYLKKDEFSSAATQINYNISVVKSGLTSLSSATIVIESNLNIVSGVVNTINSDYTKREDVSASTRYAIASGKAYTDAVSGYVATRVEAINLDLGGKIETTNNNLTGLSASVISNETKIGKVETDFKAVSGVVETIQGNYTTREEVSASTAYGILSAKTYTDDVVSTIKSDISDIQSAVTSLSGEVMTLQTNFNAVSGVVETIQSDYTTREDVSASTRYAIASGKAYTDAVSGYIETKINKINQDLGSRIDTLEGYSAGTRLDSLEAISGLTKSALQKVEVIGTSGTTSSSETIAVTYTDPSVSGVTATFDFTNFVIDCGTF